MNTHSLQSYHLLREEFVDVTPAFRKTTQESNRKMPRFLKRTNGRFVFKDDIKQRVQHNCNAVELKRLIRDCNASTIVDDDGLTLLHLCATYGNQEIAKFLMLTLPDVESRTKSGRTPLTIAIACSRFEVAELLIQMGAKVYSETHPHDSALGMAVKNSMIVPPRMFKLMYDSLKRIYTTSEMLGVLRNVECQLDCVVAMQNSVLTRLVLGSRNDIAEAESFNGIRVAMELMDVSNVRVLMHEGVDVLQRSYAFFGQLVDLATAPKVDLKAVRLFVDYVSDWHAWSLYPVDCVRRIFERAEESVLKTFLEYEIHLSIKCQTGFDMLAHLYANPSSGVADLIKHLLIKRQPIEFGIDGKPALHHAVRECAVDNVKIHLGMYENPDAVDRHGRPALFEAFRSSQNVVGKEECVQQLLLCGADVQIVDYKGETVFNLCRGVDDHHLIQLVLAHLAMRESLGFLVKENIKFQIMKNDFLIRRYRQCREQLDLMKKYWVSKNVTAYACVTQPTTIIARYLTDKAMKNMSTHRTFVAKMNVYYAALFDGLLNEIKLIRARKAKACLVVGQCFEGIRMSEAIVEKIVGYLSYIDLCAFN